MAARWLAAARAPAAEAPLYEPVDESPEILELVRSFAGELPERARAIADAERRGDLAEVGRLSHQLRGSAGSYGFPSVTEAAATVEWAATTRVGPETLRRHTDALVTLCGRATAALHDRAA